jgi:Domain of unknown function (DUF6851)
MRPLLRPLAVAAALALAAAPVAHAGAPAHSVARLWDEALLDLIRLDRPAPTVHSRNLFHVSAAMWDAWSAYDPALTGYYVDETATAVDVEAARAKALSFAVYRILRFRFVEPKASAGAAALAATSLDALMDSLGYDPDYTATSGDADPPAELGNRIGDAIIALGLTDGSNEAGTPPYSDPTYVPVNPPMVVDVPGVLQPTDPDEPPPELPDPNRWQPLSLDFLVLQNGIIVGAATQTFLGAGWRNVPPFAQTRDLPTDVYQDQGPPWRLGCEDGPPCASDTRLKADVVDLIRKSSQLDPDDGALIDISPGAWGNNPLASNDGVGYPLNPRTGLPYAPNVVKRADFDRVLAEFWADGPHSETPPGHWNTIANYVSDHPQVVKRIGGSGPIVNDLEWDVKLYFALNGALYDAAITAWTHKRAYDSARPITLIRYMGGQGQSSDPHELSYDPEGLPLVAGLIEVITAESSAPGERHAHLVEGGYPAIGKMAIYAWPGQPDDPATEHSGAAWIFADAWLPYMAETFVTPPFPGYISGHSTFSRSAAEAMTRFTGDDYFPGGLGTFLAPQNAFLDIESGPTTDVELQWARYYDAADQAGLARLLSGIHPRMDDFAGRTAGSAVGIAAYALAHQYFAPEPGALACAAAAAVVLWLAGRRRARTR